MSIRVGCAVLVEENGKVLLGKRGKEPMYGKWIIPGGGIDAYESYKATGAREILEETGLVIEVGGIVKVAEIIVPEKEHRIVLYVNAKPVGGTLQANSDLLDVKYCTREEMQVLYDAGEMTPTVAGVLVELGWIQESKMAA